MTKIKEMSKRQRKVLDACHNGWFMSGEYRAGLTARSSCSRTLTSGSPPTSRTTRTRTCSSSALPLRKRHSIPLWEEEPAGSFFFAVTPRRGGRYALA